jgi:hypothetical protein
MNKRNWVARTALVCSLATLGMGAASADTIQASFLAAGVQTPAGITTNYETFNSRPAGSGNGFTTNFNGSSYTGTYTGGITISAANQYGGAGGSGVFPTTTSSYTLALNKSANYFGLWFSALDAGNQLQFYSNGSLVYSFTPADFISLVGECPGTGFCGNPNNHQDGGEQFAYLNFYDPTGTFDSIVFSQISGGGFESDNHAVAMLSAPPGGTIITPTPEPATLGIMLAGGALVLVSRLKRRA